MNSLQNGKRRARQVNINNPIEVRVSIQKLRDSECAGMFEEEMRRRGGVVMLYKRKVKGMCWD
jgi:hypothetical protein